VGEFSASPDEGSRYRTYRTYPTDPTDPAAELPGCGGYGLPRVPKEWMR